MCTHADAQTSTASESFRCDVCRQRRAFFNEKATTRVYVTRQKLLDFSCFAFVRAFGKYLAENRESVDGFRGGRDREIFRFVNELAKAVPFNRHKCCLRCERWILSAYTINCLPPNGSAERCTSSPYTEVKSLPRASREASAEVFAVGAQRRFYKFIYRNDVRRRAFAWLFARVNICRVFPARDENKLCVTRALCDGRSPRWIFPLIIPRNWRYRSTPTCVSRRAHFLFIRRSLVSRSRESSSVNRHVHYSRDRRADDKRCRYGQKADVVV